MNATDPQQPATPDDAETPEETSAVDTLRAEAEQHRADFLRAIAELENVRKRSAREIDAARQFGVERFAADLLPVADTLALALESAANAAAATLLEGQHATLRLLKKAFEQAGLAEIDPAGQPFDPARHEAMAMRPSSEHPPHTVAQVIQKGWLLNGRLLRPARVIVSTAPEPESAPADG
jgi:molecular chaperone GrpE